MNFFKWLFGRKQNSKKENHVVYIGGASDKVRKALVMGINDYKGKANNLRGCIPDAENMFATLKDVYKYNKIIKLLDEEVTSSNLKAKISELMQDPKPDILTITYSGHGSSVADNTGTETDGRCETWYLSDGNFMDKDIKRVLATIPESCKVIVFSDSCHSCGVTRDFLNTMNDTSYISLPRYAPPKDDVEAVELSMLPVTKAVFESHNDMKEVLLAGCKSNQYSYDITLNGKPSGAFTGYTMAILKSTPDITYQEFITKMNEYLPNLKYPQNPVLECSDAMKGEKLFQ